MSICEHGIDSRKEICTECYIAGMQADIERLGVDINDLSMLLRRLASRHPDDEVSRKAMEYLSRKGLAGEPLRDEDTALQVGQALIDERNAMEEEKR